jgi:hypothetical protein
VTPEPPQRSGDQHVPHSEHTTSTPLFHNGPGEGRGVVEVAGRTRATTDLFMATHNVLAGMADYIEKRSGRSWVPNPATRARTSRTSGTSTPSGGRLSVAGLVPAAQPNCTGRSELGLMTPPSQHPLKERTVRWCQRKPRRITLATEAAGGKH